MKRLLMVCCVLGLSAHADVEYSDNVTWSYNIVRDKAFLYGISSPAPICETNDVLYIPSTLGGKPVVDIKGGITADWNTKLHIPASVTSVRHGAIANNSSYTYTNRLQWITVDAGNGYYKSIDGCLYTKDGRTFVRCPGGRLGRVVVASGTQHIADNAFNGCFGVTEISLPNTVVSIGASACACACYRYSGNGSHYQTSLRSVNIPSSVRYIGNQAFGECRELDEDINIPDGVQRIGWQAFSNCSKIRSLTLPQSLVEIGYEAFKGCSGLSGNLFIPDGVRIIGASAFSECAALTSVSGGLRVSACGSDAFKGASIAPENLPTFIHEIGSRQYYGNAGLISVTIPSSIVKIGESAFDDCDNLTTVVVPGSVKVIGYYAFGCQALSSITLSEGIEEICGYAFWGVKCTELVIPASVKRFGYRNETSTDSAYSVYYAGSWDSPAKIKFKGLPPQGFSTSSIHSFVKVYYPQKYASEWAAVVPTTSSYFGGYSD